MDTFITDLHLNDELPAMGSGRRAVRVKTGRKWAHLSWPALSPRYSTKVRLDVLEKLEVGERRDVSYE